MGRYIAKVAVAKAVYSIDKPYDYYVPSALARQLQAGMRVMVPFGRGNRVSDAMVLLVQHEGQAEHHLKEIYALLDDAPVLSANEIKLALWMHEQYFCTVYECVKAMLPAGLYFSLMDCLVLTDDFEAAQLSPSTQAQQLLELLRGWGGRGTMEQIRLAFGTKSPNEAMAQLISSGVAKLEPSAQRGIGDKTEKVAHLAMDAEDAMALVTPRRESAHLRYRVTELLCMLGTASVKELCYFTGASTQTIKSLQRSGILTLQEQQTFRRPKTDFVPPAPAPQLNPEQQRAFDGLSQLMQQGTAAAALLYGVTGSGKTQVYLRLIHQALAVGCSALILVPEIILTPQMLRVFMAQFGDQIAVLHSGLRTGERYDEWKRIRAGKARVVLGTRSAVFAPLEKIGLIVLDEEQESSYQSEQSPRYHAREVAKYRAVQHNALLVLGSATPDVQSMYYAQIGKYHFFTLSTRYNEQTLPQVEIVDMKQELRQGNDTAISAPLKQEIETNLQRGEQTILLLNRRGASRMVSCWECGAVPECPRCTVKLTYHLANGRLMCHQCGFSQPVPKRCPACGGELNFIGVGTQRVQQELEQVFPNTAILRMDTDTITAKTPHEVLLRRFTNEKIPILIGTQMVAKGLDFENVTLVGALAADLSLYVDDFRAGERTFSLLAQVIGRAGRGAKQGRAIIQTYTPENDIIACAAKQDYDAFYNGEIELRKLRNAPPFATVIMLTAIGLDETQVLRCCVKMRQALTHTLAQTGHWSILGPAPAAVAKVNNRYRYHLTISGNTGKAARSAISAVLCAASTDKENKGVAVYANYS